MSMMRELTVLSLPVRRSRLDTEGKMSVELQ
jgi:hypothetical protein